MDVLRSCYSSTWNFPGVGLVKGYYYFADPGTPFAPMLHYFGSRNWHNNDLSPWPEFGEIETAKQKWRNGAFPVAKPRPIVVGDAKCVSGDTDMSGSLPVILIAGVDSRCWTPPPIPFYFPSAGGDLAGVRSDSSPGWIRAATLGDLAGVRSTEVNAFHSSPAGGDVAGVTATPSNAFGSSPAGGDVAGVSSTSSTAFTSSPAGGDLADAPSNRIIHLTRPSLGGGRCGPKSNSSHHP